MILRGGGVVQCIDLVVARAPRQILHSVIRRVTQPRHHTDVVFLREAVPLAPIRRTRLVAQIEGKAALRTEREHAGLQVFTLQKPQPERVTRVDKGRLFVKCPRAKLLLELAPRQPLDLRAQLAQRETGRPRAPIRDRIKRRAKQPERPAGRGPLRVAAGIFRRREKHSGLRPRLGQGRRGRATARIDFTLDDAELREGFAQHLPLALVEAPRPERHLGAGQVAVKEPDRAGHAADIADVFVLEPLTQEDARPLG